MNPNQVLVGTARTMAVLFLLASAVGATACSEDSPGPGVVEIRWKLQGTICKTAGIDQVRVDLMQDGVVISSETGECDLGRMVIRDVIAGVYDVRALGLDKDSQALYEGFYPGLKVREGDVASSPADPIPLVIRTGELKLMWLLPSQKPCSGNNIEQVEVNLWRDNDPIVTEAMFLCDPGSMDFKDMDVFFEQGWLVFPEVTPGTIDVMLFAISPDGKRVAAGEKTIEVPIGDSVDVEIQLKTCIDPCT